MERSIDFLVARSREALRDPELTAIARGAREAESATAACNQAKDLLKDRKGLWSWNDLSQKDLKPAQSCRFAWMLYQRSKEEFEKQVSALQQGEEKVSQTEEKSKMEGKEMGIEDLGIKTKKKKTINLEKAELILPHGIKVITEEDYHGPYLEQKRKLRFVSSKRFEEVLLEMLDLYNVADFRRLFEKEMKEKLIQILEGKFGLEPFIEVLEKNGLKIKTKENCRFRRSGWCFINPESPQRGELITCPCEDNWEPKEKEVSEEEKRVLSNSDVRAFEI